MSPRQWQHRVQDILEAVAKIGRYTEGMTFTHFQADQRTIDAVIRNFIVIGEAAGRLPAEVRDAHPDVPWRLMADLRNFAVHEYWGVRLDTIWEAVQRDLPGLVEPLQAILSQRN